MDYSQEKRALYKYARKPLWYIPLGLLCVALGAVMASGYSDPIMKGIWWVALALPGIAMIAIMVYVNVNLKNRINELMESADARIVINDFQKAGRAFKGTLILGDKFIIPKGSGNIVAYTDFDKLHQVRNTYNGIDMNMTVFVRRADTGKKITLCIIPKKIYNEAEMQGVISFMISKNPKLTFGSF